jgi:hypothetical protein
VRGAARRIALIAGGIVGLTLLGGALAALLFGMALDRAVSTGLYLVGSFLVLVGVFAGLRGPVRPGGDDEGRSALGGLLGFGIFSSGVRTATAEERLDARATAWLFLALGVALVLLGVLVDDRASII